MTFKKFFSGAWGKIKQHSLLILGCVTALLALVVVFGTGGIV